MPATCLATIVAILKEANYKGYNTKVFEPIHICLLVRSGRNTHDAYYV